MYSLSPFGVYASPHRLASNIRRFQRKGEIMSERTELLGTDGFRGVFENTDIPGTINPSTIQVKQATLCKSVSDKEQA